MDMLRKVSIIPVALIALYAFSIKPTAMPVNPSQPIPGPVSQVPSWTQQNDLEEQIVVVAYANNVSIKKDVMATSESERKIASGAFSYTEVETKPVFQQSIKNYLKYIADNITYPVKAAENGITGKVVVSYIVDKDGKITDVKSPVKIDLLSNEVERVIKSMPAWKPGSQRDKSVPVQCYAFVEFRLME